MLSYSQNISHNLAIPVIEQFANCAFPAENPNIQQQLQNRQLLAQSICQYLASNKSQPSAQLLQEYYIAIQTLLRHSDTERILLYLPFNELKAAPVDFRKSYINAWCNLLSVHDPRENFHEGDVFEPDARPAGKVEFVVKAAHLTPWLIQAELLNFEMLENILLQAQDDILLLQNFRETYPVLQKMELLHSHELDRIAQLTQSAPPRQKLNPLYISNQRQKWLNEQAQTSPRLFTPHANLAGPFTPNLNALLSQLTEIQQNLNPTDIVLISGSRLHGYGTITSDLDLFVLQNLSQDPHNLPGSINHAYLCLTSAWLGGTKVENLSQIITKTIAQYFQHPQYLDILNRLESGILQYRLLHKGFKRFYGIKKFATSIYPEIDGDCAFYDENYRRIATQLFAKYVFLPHF